MASSSGSPRTARGGSRIAKPPAITCGCAAFSAASSMVLMTLNGSAAPLRTISASDEVGRNSSKIQPRTSVSSIRSIAVR